MGSVERTRPLRIMNISGSPCDKRNAIAKAAAMDEHIDVLVGDWMSELNMPTRAYNVANGLGIGYEETFLEALEPALENIAKKGIKLAANAGTVATKELYDIVVKMAKDKGLDLTIAWIEGDAVLDLVKDKLKKEPKKFVHISTGKSLDEWDFDPLFAQCYLGGLGIATAFKAGVDIVIYGRVADASPIIGAAAWWHNWSRTDYDKLAQSLIAGHLIECSVYVTGGNFCGFKSLDWAGINDLGYPIAEIAYDGDVIITKVENTGGLVSIETCKEQLLYEIQGMYYLNCDVTAVIDQARFTELAPNRVRLSGITGRPPPATTKMGLIAFGGYQAELHWAMIGLDIDERVKLLDEQLRHSFGNRGWRNSACGISPSMVRLPRIQGTKTLVLWMYACSRRPKMPRTCLKQISSDRHSIKYAHLSSGNFHADLRTAVPKVLAAIISAHNPIGLSSSGPTKRVQLGRIVYGRAGDKGSNCNVGLFARNVEEWPWLRSFLTTEKLIELMDEEYKGQKIDRMEFPNLWAVHFLLHDHLDRGVTANAWYDILGKFIAEFLRLKQVDVPVVFLEKALL
ncbi:DUF1446-domain-containing protein [Hyaloscypha variabilis F]|uniref:DUF1446-domain-containing protein n=1 Tax=Hyaloscypha variabilis (strain UAMH 11265 / GT02V1 / F) TaxID=1149755 RepID=A0A2J6RF67_HYAVF|nr:DUF1446-domain-containing protein [Hyaloscypha variabilis F]